MQHINASPARMQNCDLSRRQRTGVLAALTLFSVLSVGLCRAESLPEAPERTYVPIEQFQAILHRDREGVLLDRDKFETLWKEARENETKGPDDTAGLVITACDYKATVDDHSLVIEATLSYRQFVEGWHSIPILLEDVSIESATVGDQPARLGRNSNGVLQFFHNEPGKIELKLTLVARLAAVGSDQLASFQLIPGPPSELQITVPAGKHLVYDGQALERPAEMDAPAAYQLAIGGSPRLSLRITDRQKEALTDSLVFANSLIGVDATPGEIRWRSLTHLQIYGQSLNQFILRVPSRLEIADVQSGGLDAWDMNTDPEDDQQTILTLNYRQPISGSRDIELRGVLAMPPDEEWTIPQLGIQNVNSHVGHVVIMHPAAVRIQFLNESGIRRSTRYTREQLPKFLAEIPDRVTPQVFEYFREDFELGLLMRTRDRELVANIQNLLSLSYEKIQYQAEITLVCRYAPLFELDLELPAEWLPTAISVNGVAQEWEDISEEAGSRSLRVKFNTPLLPNQELKASLTAVHEQDSWPPPIDPEADPVEIELPQVLLPQVNLFDGRYLINAHPDFEVRPLELSGLNRAVVNANGERLAYDYQDTEFTGVFSLRRRSTHLSARTMTYSRRDPRALSSYLEAIIVQEGSGIRELVVSLPASAGTNLQFELAANQGSIVEQKPAEPVGGTTDWTITFDRRMYGTFAIFTVTSEDAADETSEMSVPKLIVKAAERQSGIVAIEAGPEQNLTIEASTQTQTPLRELDPEEVPATSSGYVPQERIVAVYRAVTPEYTIQLSAERFDRTTVPTAIGHRMQIQSLVGESGRWQHEAVALFSTVGVQSLLVTLPESAELWSTMLDGNPIEVRRVGNQYLIPLVDTEAVADQRELKLIYLTRSAELSRTGRLEQTPPIISVELDGKLQPVEILDISWNIYTPENVQITNADGLFRTKDEYQAGGLMTQFMQLLERVTWARVITMVSITFVFIAVGYLTLSVAEKGTGKLLLFLSLLLLFGVMIISSVPNLLSRREYAGESSSKNNLKQIGMAVHDYEDAAVESEEFYEMSGGTEAVMPPGDYMRDDVQYLPKSEAATPDAAEPAKPREAPQVEALSEEFVREKNMPAGEASSSRTPAIQTENDFSELSLQIRQTQERDREGELNAAFAEPQLDGEIPKDGWVKGARLSVAVNLAIPEHHRLTELHYFGTQTDFDESESPLSVRYMNRFAAGGLTGLVVALTLLVFYVLRKRPVGKRIMLHVLCVTIPLALTAFVPANLLFILDGVVLGSLIGAAAWALTACCRCCCVPLCSKLMNCCRPRTVTTALLLCTVLSCGSSLFAQPQPNQAPNPPAANQPASQGMLMPPVPPKPNWTVIIPYELGNDPFAASKVFLSKQQYIELWNRTHPDDPLGQGGVTTGPSVSGASFVATVEGEGDTASMKITARFVLQAISDKSLSVNLPIKRVALESALLDDAQVALTPLASKDGDAYQVQLPSAGVHLLDLVFRLPLKEATTSGQFTLPLSREVVGRLTVKLPAADLNVQVNGTTTAYRRVKEAETESILVPLSTNGPISVSWSPSRTEAGFDRIVHVNSISGLFVTDAGLTLQNQFRYSIPQGVVEELLFQLPAGWELQSIAGEDVGGWEIEQNDQQRLIRIFLRREVDDATEVQFAMFRNADLDEMQIEIEYPHITPQQITGEKGVTGLYSSDQYRIRPGGVEFMTQSETKTFPGIENSLLPAERLQYAFRYARNDYRVPLIIQRKEPEAKAKSQHALIVQASRVQAATKYRVDLTSSPRSRLSILLPETYVILDVVATELQDWYQTESTDGDRLLIVEFPRPLTGKVEVTLQGYLRKDPVDEFAELLLPTLLEMSEDETKLSVWGRSDYRLTVEDIDGWKQTNVRETPAEIRALHKELPVFTFESTQISDRYLGLLIEKIKPVLKADTVTIVNVTNAAVVYQLAIRWEITQAATDRFVFTTPESLAGKLDFTDAPLLQNYSSEVMDDGRIRWTIFLSQPQSQGYFLSPLAVLPLPGDGTLEIPQLSVEQFPHGFEEEEFTPLARQRHYIALVNQSDFQLTAQDASLIEKIPMSELPLNPQQTLLQQATEIFRVRSDRQRPTWTMTTFKQKRGAAAVVNFAQLTTVLERDGSWRTKASYLIRNSNRQFLALHIPEDARLMAALVRNEPVRPVVTKLGDKQITLLPLPKASEADLSFFAEIILAGRLPNHDLVSSVPLIAEKIDLPAPSVVPQKESELFGIPVSRTAWTVWLSEDLNVDEVNDVTRMNLSPQETATAQLDLQIAQLKELNDRLSTIHDSQSMVVQEKLLYNVTRLEQEIAQEKAKYNEQSARRYKGKASGQLMELEDQERMLGENRGRLQSEVLSKQQQIQTDAYSFGLNNFNTLDSRAQVDLLRSGNSVLTRNNAFGDQITNGTTIFSDGTANDLNFEIETSPTKEAEMDNKPGEGKSGKDGPADFKQSLKKRISNESQQAFGDEFQSQTRSGGRRGEAGPQSGAGLQDPFGQPMNQSGTYDQGGQGQPDSRFSGRNSFYERGAQLETPTGPPVFSSFGGMQQGGGQSGGFGAGGAPGGGGFVPLQAAGNPDTVLGFVAPGDDGRRQQDAVEQMLMGGETAATGMSLKFDIPRYGKSHTFSKAGGEPRLALKLKPTDYWTQNGQLIWSLIWIALTIAAVKFLTSRDWDSLSRKDAGGLLTLVGLTLSVILPMSLLWIGLLLLLSGLILLGTHRYLTLQEE